MTEFTKEHLARIATDVPSRVSDHDTACTCDRCRMMVMPTTRTAGESVLQDINPYDLSSHGGLPALYKPLDFSAGGYPEHTYVGKNTTVADLSARIAELEEENTYLNRSQCTLARERDELEHENAKLRAELAEEQANHRSV